MPKQKNVLSPSEQRERFEQTVRDMASDGKLNPTDADAKMESLLRLGARKPPESCDSSE